MATFEIFPGYIAERLQETPGKIEFAYKITGPRKPLGQLWSIYAALCVS